MTKEKAEVEQGAELTGFTLVELAIGLVFIAILGLITTTLVLTTVRTYTRGLAIKRINTTGQELVDEFTGTIQASPSQDFTTICSLAGYEDDELAECVSDNAYGLIYQQYYSDAVNSADGDISMAPAYGVMCTGSYSYIWNSGYSLSNSVAKMTSTAGNLRLKMKTSAGGVFTVENERLVRVPDSGRNVCRAMISKMYGNYKKYASVRKGVDTQSGDWVGRLETENNSLLLDLTGTGLNVVYGVDNYEVINSSTNSNSSAGLAVYDIYVSEPSLDTKTKRLFYSVSFVLATLEGGVDVTATGNYCSVGNKKTMENLTNCAINQFKFSAQTKGQ